MIARATAAMTPISASLRGPIIKYGASCLTELIKTFLEKDVSFENLLYVLVTSLKHTFMIMRGISQSLA
jgi:hypothetical protein